MLRGAEAELVDLLSDKWVGVGGDEKYPVTPVPAVLEVAKSPRRVFMASLSALVVDHSAVPASAAFIMVAMLCDGDTFYTADVVRCAVSRCPTHPSALLLAYPLTPTHTHPSPLHVTPFFHPPPPTSTNPASTAWWPPKAATASFASTTTKKARLLVRHRAGPNYQPDR